MTRESHAHNIDLKLVYIIGTYPILSTTFIDREIDTLGQLGGIEIQTVSIRRPLKHHLLSQKHRAIFEGTLYLLPASWSAFIFGNLYFIFSRPLIYLKTLIYVLTRGHPSFRARLMTVVHFWLGVYAAYLLRHHTFDHLHAHFIDRAVLLALVVGRLLDKPYSLTAHANSIYVKGVLIPEKIANARFAITVSKYNKAHLLNTYPGLDAKTIHILHPWVDLTRFVPPPTRLPNERLHILSVGRLVEKKGHNYLIEACHLLREQGIEFECRMVGAGPLKPELEELIRHHDLGSRVHLMGGQPQKEVLQLLASWADVFALPSVIARDGDRDGIPVALAEAMAMKLPVVSTEIVGISELVQPGTGILVAARSAPALAEALKTIQDLPLSARVEMGERGRAVVDAEFNLLKGTIQLADLFCERSSVRDRHC